MGLAGEGMDANIFRHGGTPPVVDVSVVAPISVPSRHVVLLEPSRDAPCPPVSRHARRPSC